jgi:hypothetical protein
VSKVVNWGHWVVAALFAVSGGAWLWDSIARLPVVFREHPQEVTYYFVSDAFLWAPALLCAWGILKWRSWARTLGVILSAFIFAVYGIAFVIARKLDWAMALIYCSALMWLLLPVVGAEYSRRNQIA